MRTMVDRIVCIFLMAFGLALSLAVGLFWIRELVDRGDPAMATIAALSLAATTLILGIAGYPTEGARPPEGDGK